jgi:hypothetical protein
MVQNHSMTAPAHGIFSTSSNMLLPSAIMMGWQNAHHILCMSDN